MKIGIMLESLGLPFRQALAVAARSGVTGVQFHSVGELAPERLSDTGRRELRSILKNHNLNLTALNCSLRYGLDEAQNAQARLEHIRRVMDLSYELGARITVVPCPRLPAEGVTNSGILHEALVDLGQHGDRTGTDLALEVGLDSMERTADYLKSFQRASLRVNYDPANLMLRDQDPIRSMLPLAGLISHVQARDVQQARVSRTAAEVAVGAGDIDWLTLMGTLASLEYRGWIVIKRESAQCQPAELSAAVAFLSRMIMR